MPTRELTISTANSRTSTHWTNSLTTKQDITARIYEPIALDMTQDEYQALPKAERDKAKDHGGYVLGHLRGGRRRKGHVHNRSAITLDIDNLPTDTNLPQVLQDNLDAAWLAHTTTSHTPTQPRWRVIIWLDRNVTPDEYTALARRAAQDINPGLTWLDQTTYQPERMMFWPAATTDGDYQAHVSTGRQDLDVDAWLDRFTDWTDITTWPGMTTDDAERAQRAQQSGGKYQDPREKPGMIGAFNRAYPITKAITTFLADVYKPGTMKDRWTYQGGTSTNGLIVYDNNTIAYSQHATDPACEQRCTAFDLVRIHKYGDLDDDAAPGTPVNKLPSYVAMTEFATNDRATKLENAKETVEKISEVFDVVPGATAGESPTDATETAEAGKQPAATPSTPDTSWVADLEMAKGGAIKDTFDNFVMIFTHDHHYNHISLDAHANTLAVTDPQALPWKQVKEGWSETDMAQLKQSIAATYGGLYAPTKMQDALAATAAARAFHPVRDYFKLLPPWDGIERLDTLLVDYLGAKDTAYTRAVTRKTLVAAVRRTLRPGTKFDQVLTLVGPQGIGKSTIWAKLAGQWFSDDMTISDMKDKTAAEKLAGNIIVEIAELAGMRKTEAESVKAFISRTTDKFRPAYGRTVEVYPRECILVATTNATDGFLRDPTGNRRWWAVNVAGHGQANVHKLTQATIDQIWAEAKMREKQGESLYLEGDVAQAATAAQTEAAESDDRTGIVAEYLDKVLPANWDTLPLGARRIYLDGGILPGEYKQSDMWEHAGPRETVSKIEIWAECFGRDPDAMKRSDSYDIAAIMAQIDGWENTGDREHLPLYGRQRVYRRGRVLAPK
ncbi:virulence-associated E family protein [Corynebacterium phoceense]|uniref:virulence-associated E family protein n=1 Tax=Corynebacterium phoceense TaxID=1686286 RepID=UPI00211CB7F0|nr:virulence-associated E family protein [Corynebacterium phoceense]MCQ9341320.1 virulence-associated E family protein [Corynebacterium phoceense]